MTATAAVVEHELLNPPNDGVSNAIFGHTSADYLLVSSWDKHVRLYDAKKNALLFHYDHKAAVLDCCFSEDDSHGFSGGLDRNLVMTDFKSGKSQVLGSHDQPIRCVNFHAGTGRVVSGGWDSNVNLWDPRAQKAQAGTASLPEGGKVYSMDVVGNRLVVATHTRQVIIYDVRSLGTPEQVRTSSLIHQTRCVRIFPDGEGYALSSIEGRVAIEYFDPSAKAQKNKYAFKCHRTTVGKTQTLYPVNAIAYNSKYGTFATGGCDGFINIWDGKNKKRICQYTKYPTSIASLNFNPSGTLLAIAASYTFEEGEKDHPADAVYVRTVNDAEIKPKSQAAGAGGAEESKA